MRMTALATGHLRHLLRIGLPSGQRTDTAGRTSTGRGLVGELPAAPDADEAEINDWERVPVVSARHDVASLKSQFSPPKVFSIAAR
jgi:hypothetical protein